nr:enoyl-CoA hydratase/isomerase family protein [Parachlamydiaceae bacterium]
MTQNTFQKKINESGICTVTFDLQGEKVNKFSLAVLKELESVVDALATNNEIKALIFKSGKKGIFIAGADLNEFMPAFKEPALLEELIHTGHRVFRKIEELPFPTIAVIDGVCLGGGLECALAFKYRIVTDNPKTSLGLPEVTLGIFPGWGGTQRLPRLIGLSEGVPMILSGRPVNGAKAVKIHLADAIVASEFQDEKIKEFLGKIMSSSGKKGVLYGRKRALWKSLLLENNPLGRSLFFSKAKSELQKKTKGHYRAPEIALNLIQETYPLPLEKGLDKEAKCVLSNIGSGFTEAVNLIGLFFIQESLKKNAGREISAKPREIRTTAVLGSGTMGSGIGWLLADNN